MLLCRCVLHEKIKGRTHHTRVCFFKCTLKSGPGQWQQTSWTPVTIQGKRDHLDNVDSAEALDVIPRFSVELPAQLLLQGALLAL